MRTTVTRKVVRWSAHLRCLCVDFTGGVSLSLSSVRFTVHIELDSATTRTQVRLGTVPQTEQSPTSPLLNDLPLDRSP